jgi:hypothetical protein
VRTLCGPSVHRDDTACVRPAMATPPVVLQGRSRGMIALINRVRGRARVDAKHVQARNGLKSQCSLLVIAIRHLFHEIHGFEKTTQKENRHTGHAIDASRSVDQAVASRGDTAWAGTCGKLSCVKRRCGEEEQEWRVYGCVCVCVCV